MNKRNMAADLCCVLNPDGQGACRYCSRELCHSCSVIREKQKSKLQSNWCKLAEGFSLCTERDPSLPTGFDGHYYA